MIATVGAFAHGDDMQDPNIVGRALASRMLDYGLVFGASAGVQALTEATLGVPSVDWFVDRSWLLSAWAVTTMSAPMWTYNTLLVSGPRQATLGHRASGVSVVTLDGHPVSAGRSLLRSAVMFVGWELAHVSMFVPRNLATDDPADWQYVGLVAANAYLVAEIVTIIATGGRRSIADLVVGTRLVRTASRPSPATR
ncbi:MAG: hypothetical protein GVY29_06920 [Spirochaetes bacterium]|nr:hypothetical protein [Spirochaetota bacterium]